MKHISEVSISDKQVASDKPTEKKFICSLCKDTGIIFKNDIGYVCSCQKNKRQQLKQKKAGITPLLSTASFDAFCLDYYSDVNKAINGNTYYENASLILNASKEYCKLIAMGKNPGGMMFTGPVGSGKTFLAAACGNYLIQQGINVKFLVVPDFLDELRNTFHNGAGVSEYDLMDEVKNADVLILDDLGAHNYSDYTVKSIFTLLNYRVNYEKPLLVTTNLNRKQIEELLGSRVYSRLTEACRFFLLDTDSDIRIEKRKSLQRSNR